MKRHHTIIISILSIIAISWILVLMIAFYIGRDNKSQVSYNYGHDYDYICTAFTDDYNDIGGNGAVYIEKPWKLDDGLIFGKDKNEVPNSPEPGTSVLLFTGLLAYVGYQRKK